MDEETKTTIEHGKRIRACLKQSEFSPVSVSEQIGLLLALAENLMDSIPLERIVEAENALFRAVNALPEALRARLDSAEKLSDADRATMIDAARGALAL